MPARSALRGIREQRGLETEAVERYANFGAGRLLAFEAGERDPSRQQLQKLADLYGVPLYALAGKAALELPAPPTDFRKTEPTPAKLSPAGVKTLLTSERISAFTSQLAHELRYRPVDLAPSTRRANSLKTRASALRRVFDAWFSGRRDKLAFAGTPEQRFMGALRLFFEAQGGVVNINDAPATDYMGFYVEPDDGLPTIFVNRSVSSKKAQLFTFAHEYAHALTKEDGISNPFRALNSIERRCNVFAAEVLAPMDEFAETVNGLSKIDRSDAPSLISAASSRTLLSKHAAAIRLVEAGYITQKELRAWRALFVQKPTAEKEEEKEIAPSTGGRVPHAKRIGELGYLPVVLAKRAIDKKIVDALDVANGIGLSPKLQERAFTLATRRFEVATT